MKLDKMEIDYLKLFLKLTEKNGVHGLVTACENREFAMLPFINMISKIVQEGEEQVLKDKINENKNFRRESK